MSGERLPLIRETNWVRLGRHVSVPDDYRGRDAVVVQAPTVRTEADDFSTTPYEAQDADTLFVVRERDSNQLLELKREAFSWWGPTQLLGSPQAPLGSTPPNDEVAEAAAEAIKEDAREKKAAFDSIIRTEEVPYEKTKEKAKT